MDVLKKVVLAVTALFSLTFPLAAKSPKSAVSVRTVVSDSESEEEDASSQWQILEWEDRDSKYVYKYEVVIDELDPKTEEWKQVNSIQTKGNETRIQIQPYLMPGNYRFMVITYDLFGYPSVESDWYDFNIYEAYVPEVRDASVALYFGNTIFLDELNDGVMNISGKNLFDLPEGESDINYTEYFLVPSGRRFSSEIAPEVLEHDDKNSKLKLQFNLLDLDTGSYNLVARDASGLESERSDKNTIRIKFKKAVDFDISAGYTCPVLLFDSTLPSYMGSRLIPVGAAAKLCLMPIKHTWGYLGIGVNATYSMHSNFTPEYDIVGNLLTGYMNLVYQYPVYANKTDMNKRRHLGTLEVRAGGGGDFFLNYTFYYPHNVKGLPLNTVAYGWDAGASFQLYMTNRIYLEASLDYTMTFGNNLMVGKLVPCVYAGVQL